MRLSQNLLYDKGKYLLGCMLLLCIAVICTAFSLSGNDDFDISRREVLLRKIGHQLLLQSGDSSSRVLPIEKIAEHHYRIRFEKDLAFQSDSLIAITRRLLAMDPVASDYVVNVLNCGNASVAYGYSVSKTGKDDILACMGRKQPIGCYMIEIKFRPAGMNAARSGYLLGSLSFLAFLGFVFFRSFTTRTPVAGNPGPDSPHTDQATDKSNVMDRSDTELFTIGSMLFDARNRRLVINATAVANAETMANAKTIDLTGTETRLLRIFALSPNQTIERSLLQKQIWEDQGVIVGRSLDMFISKLRKKLESDPNSKIVVVRGKGYKLENNLH